MTRRILGRLTAIVLVAGLLAACTSERSDDDVAELTALDDPVAALDWLGDGDTVDVADREVSARLHGLVHDRWPDDGEAAAEVLTSALNDGPAGEDRATLTAQLMHVLAHKDVAEDAVREAAATVLAGHADDVRRLASDTPSSIVGQWTVTVDDSPAPFVEPSTLGDATEKLGDEGLVVLTALAHARRNEMVEAAAAAGEPRTISNLLVSGTDSVLTDGLATGSVINLVLSRSFDDSDARLAALSTAVQIASAAPADATAADLAVAVDDADTVLIADASRLMDILTINALLEAGFLDVSVDPDRGLPPQTLVDGRLDPLLFDGDVSTAADPTAPDRINSWLVSHTEPTAPYEVLGEQATGASELDLADR